MLRRYVRRRELTDSRAELALGHLRQLGITRYPHDVLLSRIWQLRQNFTAYDDAYLALAEAIEAPLLTADAALSSSRIHRARVEVIR